MEGHLKMFVGWSATAMVKHITWFFGVGRLESPAIVDTACAPYSAISESMLAHLTYPTFNRTKLDNDLVVEDAIGGTTIIKETILLDVVAKASKGFVKFAGKVEIKFMVIPRKDSNFVLLGTNALDAFDIPSPEESIWEKLVGESDEDESGDETGTDNPHDDHTGSHHLEQSKNDNRGISNATVSPATNIKPAIDMSIVNVSFNINKIRDLIGATDNLANEMFRQKQNGWGAKASEIASQLKIAFTNLQAAAMSAEDALAGKMDEDFNKAVEEIEKAKRQLRNTQTSQANVTTNTSNLAEGQQSLPMPDVTVIIPAAEQGLRMIDTEIVQGVPMEDSDKAKSKRGAKRARGQE